MQSHINRKLILTTDSSNRLLRNNWIMPPNHTNARLLKRLVTGSVFRPEYYSFSAPKIVLSQFKFYLGNCWSIQHWWTVMNNTQQLYGMMNSGLTHCGCSTTFSHSDTIWFNMNVTDTNKKLTVLSQILWNLHLWYFCFLFLVCLFFNFESSFPIDVTGKNRLIKNKKYIGGSHLALSRTRVDM